jgi:hypothetical protein
VEGGLCIGRSTDHTSSRSWDIDRNIQEKAENYMRDLIQKH